jgi:hypothetical protein
MEWLTVDGDMTGWYGYDCAGREPGTKFKATLGGGGWPAAIQFLIVAGQPPPQGAELSSECK